MIQFKIQFKTKSKIFIQKNIHSKQNPKYSFKKIFIQQSPEYSIELFIQKNEENYSKFQNKAKIWLRSAPEAPVQIIDPLKWTKKGPTNDPCMISDEFETFGNNHF